MSDPKQDRAGKMRGQALRLITYFTFVYQYYNQTPRVLPWLCFNYLILK